jgi:hypothetical protein
MKPPAPNKRDWAVSWAQVFGEDWQECKDDPAYAPDKARSLLAAWGALCRCFSPDGMPAAAAAVAALVRQDAAALLTALRQGPEPAEWLARARELDGAWDFATDPEAVRELETAAVTLLNELDRSSLAVCMASRLAADEATEPWATWRRQVAEAEEWFAGHVDAFLPAAAGAGATLAACRAGLEEDEALWQTVLKHRLLEETAEEAAAPPVLPRLGPHDLQAVQDKVGRTTLRAARPVARTELAWPAYAGVAAATGQLGWSTYECRGPREEDKALFDLAHPDLQPEVLVRFYRNGQHATDRAGTPVRLRGVVATLDGEGRARFPRAALENQTGPLRLEVGEPPVLWPFHIESQDEPRAAADPVAEPSRA